jgi:metal-responsive CopG/Arc/MetJ family transcriptional regulator
MKEKTSITLSSDVLAEVDQTAGSKGSRSAFIEAVLRQYFKEKVREAINRRDAAIINANADYFNREMEDVLRYQAPIEWTTEED